MGSEISVKMKFLISFSLNLAWEKSRELPELKSVLSRGAKSAVYDHSRSQTRSVFFGKKNRDGPEDLPNVSTKELVRVHVAVPENALQEAGETVNARTVTLEHVPPGRPGQEAGQVGTKLVKHRPLVLGDPRGGEDLLELLRGQASALVRHVDVGYPRLELEKRLLEDDEVLLGEVGRVHVHRLVQLGGLLVPGVVVDDLLHLGQAHGQVGQLDLAARHVLANLSREA